MINFDLGESQFIKRQEFIVVLNGIASCYAESLGSSKLLENDEEKIRDWLVYDYLLENEFREKYNLENYIFEAEPKHLGGVSAYIDIKVLNAKNFKNLKTDYFVVECKRLDGGKSLNRKYVTEGMNRFVIEEKYSSHYGLNAMIGFIVKDFSPLQNLNSISLLMKSEKNEIINNTIFNSSDSIFSQCNLNSNFSYSYNSKHKLAITKTDLELFHLMFNYSKLIVKKPKTKSKALKK
ncbi:hypothetical protein [Fibrella forsythiae]|uniref:Restriction endonuclease n=1 Tax=Fibrella forsythiae TaxID=2817061 RepID=A0ABS3JGU3_9BACT|nr:hypothetical protein [Fibrella forsythiae]MBO0949218.1 hypothetical protein [Fibrella forsythiae]